MKTKHGILFGIAALLATAMVLFAACGGGGSSGPQVKVPSPGELPDLPDGPAAVTDEDDDKTWIENTLMDAIDDFSDYLDDAVEEELYPEDGIGLEDLPFNKNNEEINLADYYGITSGTITVTVHADGEGSEETGGKMNGKRDIVAKTDILTDSGLLVKAGSSSSEAYSISGNQNGYNETEKFAYGLTVVYLGKAAKIVGSLTYTDTGNLSTGRRKVTEKGKITVYGADDTPVYELLIDESDETDWDGWDEDADPEPEQPGGA
jgi:hypothetical protein